MRSLNQHRGGRTHTRSPRSRRPGGASATSSQEPSPWACAALGGAAGRTQEFRQERAEHPGLCRGVRCSPPNTCTATGPAHCPALVESGWRGVFSPRRRAWPHRVRRGEGLPPRAGRAPSFRHCFSLATPREVQLPSSPGVPSPPGAAEGPGPGAPSSSSPHFLAFGHMWGRLRTHRRGKDLPSGGQLSPRWLRAAELGVTPGGWDTGSPSRARAAANRASGWG